MGITQRYRSLTAGHAEGWTWASVYLLLGIQAGLLAWGAILHSPTVDEPVHLTAGLRHLTEGRFDLNRGNPPLADVIGALPTAFMNPRVPWNEVPSSRDVAREFVEANGVRVFWYTTAGRWACIPIALLGGIACYRWARELYGRASGLLALTMWCFGPNVIAHGQLITGDMSAMAFGVLAYYAFWRWLRRPTAGRAGSAGVALGLSELAKFVWVISYVLWPLLWLAWRYTEKGGASRKEALHIALLLALSVGVINLGYGFRGSLQPLGSYRLGQQLLGLRGASEGGAGSGEDRGLKAWVAAIPVPFPDDYVRGIEEIDSVYEAPRIESYLRGEWKLGGWWYYYFYGLLVKLPLGTWLLILLACAASLVGEGYAESRRDEILLIVPAVELLAFVTCVTTVQQHVRYVMPALPFLIVFSSKIARAYTRRQRLLAIAVAAGLGWSVASSLAVYPHSLSYFNELAGGPMRGHDHLVDSNIDWGQDLRELRRWLDDHPETPLRGLAYFGAVDPSVLGIAYRWPPVADGGSTADRDRNITRKGDLRPGLYAVSVNYLRGMMFPAPDGQGGQRTVPRGAFAYFHRLRPVATAGYSIYIYHVGHPESPEASDQSGRP